MYNLLPKGRSLFFGTLIKRQASQLIVRPKPRPYRKRLFDAALSPFIDKDLERDWRKANDPLDINSLSPLPQNESQLIEYELAYVDRLLKWIQQEEFRVMVLCQLNYSKEDVIWIGKNHFRIHGLEFCDPPVNILRKLFENSQFSSLSSMLIEDCTCLLFGRANDAIGAALSQNLRFTWIVPIVVAFDNRILSIEQASEIADPNSLQNLQRRVVGLLAALPTQLAYSLDTLLQQFTYILEYRLKANEQ